MNEVGAKKTWFGGEFDPETAAELRATLERLAEQNGRTADEELAELIRRAAD